MAIKVMEGYTTSNAVEAIASARVPNFDTLLRLMNHLITHLHRHPAQLFPPCISTLQFSTPSYSHDTIYPPIIMFILCTYKRMYLNLYNL
jgi:hypothetical protein